MAILCQCPVCQKKHSVVEATDSAEPHGHCGQNDSVPTIPTCRERPAEVVTNGIPSSLYGALYSLIGSGSIAALWAGVALVWQMDVGWMAWGLGCMSGFGMACKHEGRCGTGAGILAASMSLAGIFAAKIVVFYSVLLPILRRIELGTSIAATPSLFFATMFDPIDGLFIALSIATAYKLGSQTRECD